MAKPVQSRDSGCGCCVPLPQVSFYRGEVPSDLPEEVARKRKGHENQWLATLPIKLPVSRFLLSFFLFNAHQTSIIFIQLCCCCLAHFLSSPSQFITHTNCFPSHQEKTAQFLLIDFSHRRSTGRIASSWMRASVLLWTWATQRPACWRRQTCSTSPDGSVRRGIRSASVWVSRTQRWTASSTTTGQFQDLYLHFNVGIRQDWVFTEQP